MGRHVILCAVSTIQPKAAAKSYLYRAGGSRVTEYSGTQTNEAPVKCLIECYGPVDMVLCLTSEQVRQPRTEGPGAPQSAYEYFAQAVRGFCAAGRKKPFPMPELVPLDYQTDNAGRSVGRLLEQLREGDEVYMDVTGGGRDAMFLLMMAMQMLQYKQIRLVKAVYSDFAAGQVRDWNLETDLFALIKAVEVFTSYGKADKLCQYFGLDTASAGQQGVRLSGSVKKLCKRAKEFSHSLALCRTDHLEETVSSIQKYMRSARSEPQQRPDLLLFLALIPQMQADFVREGSRPGELMLNLIEWCANHELWLQALALYRENVPKCLFELDILREDAAFCEYARKELEVKESPASREWCGKVVYNMSHLQFSLSRFPGMSGVSQGTLRQILDDWDKLRVLRNAAIHNLEPDDHKKEYQQVLKDIDDPDKVQERLIYAINRLRAAMSPQP